MFEGSGLLVEGWCLRVERLGLRGWVDCQVPYIGSRDACSQVSGLNRDFGFLVQCCVFKVQGYVAQKKQPPLPRTTVGPRV